MNDNPEIQSAIDEEHLRLLAIGYKISAGVSLFTSIFGLMYMVMGIFFSLIPNSPSQTSQPSVGWMFGILGFGFFVLSVVFAILNFITAKRLEQRRGKAFCTVIAALNCMGIPYHTVLGVLTLVTLTRKSIVELFTKDYK